MALIDLLIIVLTIFIAGGLAWMSAKERSKYRNSKKAYRRRPESVLIEAGEELIPESSLTAEIEENKIKEQEREEKETSAIPVTYKLPLNYRETKICALVRDPYWIFAYWEISEMKKGEIRQRFGQDAWETSQPVLRIFDVTNRYYFDSHKIFEIQINDYANNWYIYTGQPDHTFCLELGRLKPDGTYIFIARSNYVSTPRDSVSEFVDEEWLLLSEDAKKIYDQKNILGISSPEFFASPLKWQ